MKEQRCGACQSIGRRRIILGSLGAVALTAGCLGEDPDHEPVDLTSGATCDICGMIIEDHFGPAAQAFYDGLPRDREGPMRFDSILEMVTYDAGIDHSLEAGFATDYSRVSADIQHVDGTSYIPTVATVDAFSPLQELVFVIDSEVEGAMGPDAIPYSDPADADKFVDDFGGSVVEWEGIPATGH